MKHSFFFILFIISYFASCGNKDKINPEPEPPPNNFFSKGADISWVTQMEEEGISFYNKSGTEQDLFQLLKSYGMNTIRLRVWVNPANGWCDKNDVLTKALRAQKAGFKILINFHYSDSWADPGKQTKPAAWENEDFSHLKISLASHTTEVLNLLKQNNITPEWVQVGNETNNGMLWPDGKASENMGNFASLINAGYDAVKSVFPSTKVIVHISNGFDNGLFRWIFDGLKKNGAKWDVIGMSLYPTEANWAEMNSKCLINMNDMVKRYNKEVMICEVGMPMSDSITCKNFITGLIIKTKSVKDAKGIGVLYWEPECYNRWNGYGLGAFNNKGQPTVALEAFK